MKIKGNKLPTLRQWAKESGVSYQIAQLYERARANWRRNAQRYAAKTGADAPYGLGLKDIRTLSKGRRSATDFEAFLEAQAFSQLQRNKNTGAVVSKANEGYISNLITALDESNSEGYNDIASKIRKFSVNASQGEKQHFINIIGKDSIKLVYDGNKSSINYDLSEFGQRFKRAEKILKGL